MNKKLLSDFSVRIGLVMFLLVPLENVYADGQDHSFDKLIMILAILAVVATSIIFVFIFAKGKELLMRVIVFCASLLLLFCLLFCFVAYSVMGFDILFDIEFIVMSLIILAIIIAYIFLRSSKKKRDVIKK